MYDSEKVKSIKKKIKIWLTVFLVIILLPGVFYGIFLIPYVQTKLAHIVVNNISEKFNISMSIERARIKSFHHISLYDVLIKDEAGDSLLFISVIDAYIDSLSLKKKHLYFNRIELDRPNADILQKDTTYNFSFLLNSFKRRGGDTVSSWKVGLGALLVQNASVRYRRPVSAIDSLPLNRKIVISDLNINSDEIVTGKDLFGTVIKGLSFKLDNGFALKNVTGNVLYSGGRLVLNKIFIQSFKSGFVIDSLNLSTQGLKDLKTYAETEPVCLKVKQGSLSDRDIKYFYPRFNVFAGNLHFSGLIDGTLSKLKGKNLNLSIGNNSQLKFNFSVDGLPDISEAFLFVDIKSMTTNIADIEKLLSISKSKALEFPETFSRLGTIKYKGNFTGFLSDIVAYGSFETDLGKITTDVGVKRDDVKKQIYYAGNIGTNGFDIGKLFGYEKNLGDITMNMTIKGDRSSAEHFMVFMEGKIDSLIYNRYAYKNIMLRGLFANKVFNGDVYLRDPNGVLGFTGKIDLSKEIPEFDFFASLKDLKLDKLNLFTLLPDNELSFDIETNILGKSIEDVIGSIRITGLDFTSPEKSFSSDSLILIAERLDSVKHLVLESDLLEGELTGIYNLREMGRSVKKFVKSYLPALIRDDDTGKAEDKEVVNDFNFIINLKKVRDVVNVLFPKVHISDAGMVLGSFNSANEFVDIEGEIDSLSYDKLITHKASFYINSKKDKQLSVITRFRMLTVNNFVTFNNFSVHQKAAGDSLIVNLFWNNWDEETNSGSIFTTTHFMRSDRGLFTLIDVDESQIIANDSLWTIQPADIYMYPEGFTVKNFRIWSYNQQIGVNGYQNRGMDDELDIFIDNLNIGNVIKNRKIRNLELNGLLNCDIQLKNLYETPIVTSDISIKDLVVNSDTLGTFSISSKYDPVKEYLDLQTFLQENSKYTLSGGGGMGIKDKTVDLKFDVDSLPVVFLNMYLGHIMQNLRGTASGVVRINGSLDKPLFTGKVRANDMKFDIDLLKTSYTLSDSVFFEPQKMIFNNMTVTDKFGHKGVFKGTIQHDMFKDMVYDLSLEVNHALVLNTTENDNDVYYGTAFADGNMSITGRTNDININIVAKSVGNTSVYIPLQNNESAKESDFIRFVDDKNKEEKMDESKNKELHVDVSGMDITMDMEFTPSAKVEVIFDSKIGDILKGTGSGNLRIKVDKTGNVYFYGEYTIEQGDYMFTLQNVINKRFIINRGSTIRWDGSPYNAMIDLKATYRLKASMYELVASTVDPGSSYEYQKRVPINLNLILTGRLMKPAIKFEIKTPSLNNSNQNIIDEYITTEDELNRQVLSLLVLNQFYAPGYARGSGTKAKASGNAAVVTTTEMLSNQLSNWLSQISKDVDIGVSYRPGDEITSDEVEVALSTQMFNNRVTVSSNVGYGNYQTEDMSKIIGDFDIEVKLNQKGTIRAKAYTHSNNDIIYETSPTTQGVGISFNEEFDTFGELMRRYWAKLTGKKRREEKKQKKEEAQKALIRNENDEKVEKK